MKLIDTHTHLYVEAFDEDREEIIQKAIKIGIERFFTFPRLIVAIPQEC